METLIDLQSIIIVNERLEGAENFIMNVDEGLSTNASLENLYYNLAYGIETSDKSFLHL